MIINGKEVKFRRTVQAQIAVAEICPDKDPNKLAELLSGEYVTGQLAAADFVVALSRAYETAMAYEDHDYEPIELTRDEILCLEDGQFTDLFMEAWAAWLGEQPTIGTKPVGKKKQGRKSSSTKAGTSSSEDG